MKKSTLLPLPILILFMLSNCTEEIILPGEVIHDTTFIEIFKPKLQCDTVAWGIMVVDGDSLLYVVVDADSVTGYINQKHDSIFSYKHIYHDTLIVYESGRPLEDFDIYFDVVIDFYNESAKHGRTESAGGNLLFEPWTADEVPPNDRSAYTYYVFDQRIIKVKESLTVDESWGPIFRELARSVMGTKYNADPNSLMNPAFSPSRLKMSSSQAEKDLYLDELFSHDPI